MVSQTDLFRMKCISNGMSTYSDLPRPSPRKNVKAYLKNVGQNTTFNIGRIQSDETLRYLYVNDEKKLDVLRCIIPANDYDLAAIAGDGIMNTTMVNVTHSSTVFHLFISFLKKETVEAGGFREIHDVLPDSLKKVDGTPITLTDIGLDGDNDDPKLVILPLAIPIPIGWSIPIGHKVNEALPPADEKRFHPTMIAWLEAIKNLEDLNKGVPVTGGNGILFDSGQFHQARAGEDENNYDKICNDVGEMLSKDTYHLNPTPVLPGSDIHNQFFEESERITTRSLFDFVQGLPAEERQQTSSIPANLGQSIADGITKGMKSSTDSKRSGFTNNVEERMKLLGSFTGVNDNGEEVVIPATLSEVCKLFYQEKNKTSSTRILQDGMKAEAIAMQDEGGNIASNDLIFHPGQFTQVFVNHLKNFHFMRTHLAQMSMEFDAQISLFNFLPADEGNPSFRSMIESDRTAQDEDEMESDIAKHTKRTTKLFVDGYQETAYHLCTCLATMCCFLRTMFTNGKQSIAHKGFMNLLKYLKSAEGVNWLSTECRTHKHVVHHLVCETHSLLVAILRSLSFNDVLVQKVKNNQDIPISSADRVTATCTSLLNLWQQRSINPVSDFTIAPTTYVWFPIGTGQAVADYRQQRQQQPAQQKQPQGGGGTPIPKKANGKRQDSNIGNGNGKRQKTDEELLREKKGWLCLSVNAKKIPRFDLVVPGQKKRLCHGYMFRGRSCSAEEGTCTAVHINSVDDLKGEYKKKLIAWVDDSANNVQFADGKAPKNRE